MPTKTRRERDADWTKDQDTKITQEKTVQTQKPGPLFRTKRSVIHQFSFIKIERHSSYEPTTNDGRTKERKKGLILFSGGRRNRFVRLGMFGRMEIIDCVTRVSAMRKVNRPAKQKQQFHSSLLISNNILESFKHFWLSLLLDAKTLRNFAWLTI